MVERQLNDVELRHDPERVRVASVFDGFARLVVLPPCLFVALPSYSLSSVHYPLFVPFVPFVPLLVPSHSCPSGVLYSVLFVFFSRSFRVLFAFFSQVSTLSFASPMTLLSSFVRLLSNFFFVQVSTHSLSPFIPTFICPDALVESPVCPSNYLAEQ